ncbi:MAG: hypothetical protein KKG47_10610 [Proteobacteria bacterium]|nr:hypothetical protein [Pseudomonadota bacterium]MBU1738331.1 hypothetical protein [Pseudomonadota bacterium]
MGTEPEKDVAEEDQRRMAPTLMASTIFFGFHNRYGDQSGILGALGNYCRQENSEKYPTL